MKRNAFLECLKITEELRTMGIEPGNLDMEIARLEAEIDELLASI